MERALRSLSAVFGGPSEPERDMTPLASIRHRGVRKLAREAVQFLESQSWCGGVTTGELGFAVAGVIGVFRLVHKPTREGVDAVLWVVVGDLPSAYVVLDNAPDWQEALACYVQEMGAWVAAVRAGKPLGDIIPVGVEPTPEHADMLATRLEFIQRELVDVPASDLDGDR